MEFVPIHLQLPDVIDSIPGDKSISHRSIIISSLATGVTKINGFLCSDDCLNTLKIFQQLGVEIVRDNTVVTVTSNGINGLSQPNNLLDVGNSGTGIRLISGVLSALPFNTTISGDHSIIKRPMKRIIDPLAKMGAKIDSQAGLPPLVITGNQPISSIHYQMPMASAQVKSAILLAGAAAKVPVTVTEPEACRDHTERMLRLFGANCTNQNGQIYYDGGQLTVPKNGIQVPADISSALFFICLAIMGNQSVTFKNIGLNPSRIGCLDVLKMMNAPIEVIHSQSSFEPMGDIIVRKTDQRLKNIDIPAELVPNVIDECPILAVLATKGDGIFSVRDAEELRVKESDRIDGICRLMKSLGVHIDEYDDGFSIHPTQIVNQSFSFDAHFDHRLAMSAIIAATIYQQSATITGTESIPTSFPNFFEILGISH